MPRVHDPKIVAEMQRLAEKGGGLLSPEAVVAAAANPKSPLHPRFEWDDSKAGEQYRIMQARELLRVVVHVLPGKGGSTPERVFVSLSTDRGNGGYRTLVSVLGNAERRAQLLEDALSDLTAFRRRYAEIEELAGVFAEADTVISKAR